MLNRENSVLTTFNNDSQQNQIRLQVSRNKLFSCLNLKHLLIYLVVNPNFYKFHIACSQQIQIQLQKYLCCLCCLLVKNIVLLSSLIK